MRLKVSVGTVSKIITIPNEKANETTLFDLVNEYINPDEFKGNIPKSKYTKIRFGYPIKTVEIISLDSIVENNENDKNSNENGNGNDEDENSRYTQKTLEELGISNGEKLTIETDLDKNPIISTKQKINKEDLEYNGLQIENIPDDNSCLFHSISYCLFKPSTHNERMGYSLDLRKICADYIMKHQKEYNEVVLEKPPKEYSEWIQNKNVWGGAIEISILSKFYKIAIYVLDIGFNTFEKFNEDEYEDFIILFYNGSHYDACKRVHHVHNSKISSDGLIGDAATIDTNTDTITTVFNKNNDYETQILLIQCLELSNLLKKQGYSYAK